jgi:FKBP-type peptidyl-prolyl cis-trans isomerase
MMMTWRLARTALAGLISMPLPAAAYASQDPKPEAAAQDPSALEDDKDKASYAVGVNLGKAIRHDSGDLDLDLIVRGLKDAYSGAKPLLTDAEVRSILTRLQSERKAKQAAQRSEKAAQAKAEGEAFLAANKAKEGVVTLESGLQYKVLKVGEGKKPTIDDTVLCHYRGTLIDGTEFDSSYKRNAPATLPLKNVIKGWAEALQLMPVGSRWQLFVPSSLAYGERGAGRTIGPNATLVFEVELVSVQDASAKATAPASKSEGTSAGGPRDEPVAAPVSALAGINVSLKLDPRLTRGLYMGDRWVSLPYTQVGEGKEVTVEARAEGVDDKGKPVGVSPEWTPADPAMVTVAPGEGKQVKITALRPGESSLRVSSQGVSRELAVHAAYKGEVLQVEISQKQ